jgi:uncharacterized protein YegP (UPF0339 family)
MEMLFKNIHDFMKPRFSIYRIFARGYYFSLKNEHGKKVFTSGPYPGIKECKHGISTMKLLGTSGNYNEETAFSGGWYYFILKNTDGEIIGTSERYPSALLRNQVLLQLKSDVRLAQTIDLT